MSSRAKRMSKNTKHTYLFQDEMYNTLLGSYLISLYMTRSTPLKTTDLIKFYKEEKARWLKDEVNPQHWMEDVCDKLDTFNLKEDEERKPTVIPYGNIAFVTSNVNVLVAPYDGVRVYPLREDGLMGITLATGDVHPIEEKIEYEIHDEAKDE